MRRVDVLLQRLEGGVPGRQHEGDLAVERRLLAGELLDRPGDDRKAHGPIEPAAAVKNHVVTALPGDDAVAVIFQLVHPVVALGNVVDEGCKLRGDEFRL